jgi:prolyl oligopeptidase
VTGPARTITTLTIGGLCAVSALKGLAQSPPMAPIRSVTDTYFGVKVEDPYRYMENVTDSEVVAWMNAQSNYAREALDRLPGRAALVARMDAITRERASAQGGANLSDVRRLPGDLYFYLKTQPPRDQTGKLYMRRGVDGSEILLVDPDLSTRATGKPHVIQGYFPSFDGTHVAYGLAASGSEQAVLHVIDTSNGKEVDIPIERRVDEISWRPDGHSFFYVRQRDITPGMPGAELKQRSQVFLHTLGRNPDGDPLVFGIDAPPLGTRINPPDIPRVITTPGSRWAVGVVRDNDEGALSLFAAPLDSVRAANTPWRRVCDAGDGIETHLFSQLAVRGDELFVITHQGAPRRRVVKIDLATSDCKTAMSVVPAEGAVVDTLAVASDALYVVRRDGPVQTLLRVSTAQSGSRERTQTIPLPIEGNVRLMSLDPRVDGALLSLSGPLQPPRLYSYSPQVPRIVDAGFLSGSDVTTLDDLEVVHTKVASHDGVLVPLSIVHKRALQRNGSNPVILEGYGAYGISTDLDMRPPLRAWCELGGIYVIAHVRGGGEYGEEWHRAGYKATKPNTWKDAIAAAEYLIAEKYTSPARLAIRGASAGGILVGRAITERPDLFAVALPSVGLLDMIRYETEPNGVPNIPEFGSVASEEGFKALYAMSAYHHVRDGTRYPAVLLQVGRNDPRVTPWHSAKMAARLQAATASGRPVLFKMDDDAGHGGLNSLRGQRQADNADAMAFAMWQFGIAEFQPASPKP